jgi:hypothetical protein
VAPIRLYDNTATLQGLRGAPERIRTSTTYSGHKALNLVTRGFELTYVSVWRDVSAAADGMDTNRGAFVITAVITPNNSRSARSSNPGGAPSTSQRALARGDRQPAKRLLMGPGLAGVASAETALTSTLLTVGLNSPDTAGARRLESAPTGQNKRRTAAELA